MRNANIIKTIAFITVTAFCFTQCAFAADFLRQGQAAGGPMAKAIDADVRGLDSGEELRFRLALFLAAGKFTEAQQELLSFLDRPVAGPEEKRLAVIEDNAHEWAARALISNYLHNLKGPHQRGNLIKFLQSLHNMYAQKRTSYMQRVPTGKRQQAARIFELPQEVSVNNILDALSRYEKEGDKIAIKQAENLLSKLLMEIYLRYYSLKKYMEYMTESNNKTIEPAQGDYLPVVVTGGAGFIGATVVDMLLNNKNGIADDLLLHNGVTLRGNYKGIKIYVIDNFETGEPWKLLQYKNAIKESRLVVIPADFSKPEDVERLKQEYPGIFSGVVIHEGAFVSVPESIKNPSLCFDANKTGSFNIMNLTREAGGKVVVVSTAATVSGPSLNDDGSYKAVDEKSAYNPATYYGFTKAIMEWFAKLMQFEERPLQQTTIAYSNVTGPGQMVRGEAAVGPAVAMRVIEYARQLREWKYNGQIGEKPTPLFTIFNAGFDEPVNTQWNRDGGIRDYIPVDLAAEAAITAAFRKHNGDFIRIGNGTKMSVKEYYYRLAKALVDAGATYGISLEELGFNEGPWREGDAPYSVFNNTHMKQTLGLKGPSEEDYNKLFARIAEFYKKLFHRSYADDETKHIANTEQWRARQQKQLDRIFELQTESRANAGGNRHNDINVRKAAQAGITEGKRFSNCTVVRHFNHVFSVKLGETGYMGMVSTRTLPVEVERDRSSWPAIGSTVVCKIRTIYPKAGLPNNVDIQLTLEEEKPVQATQQIKRTGRTTIDILYDYAQQFGGLLMISAAVPLIRERLNPERSKKLNDGDIITTTAAALEKAGWNVDRTGNENVWTARPPAETPKAPPSAQKPAKPITTPEEINRLATDLRLHGSIEIDINDVPMIMQELSNIFGRHVNSFLYTVGEIGSREVYVRGKGSSKLMPALEQLRTDRVKITYERDYETVIVYILPATANAAGAYSVKELQGLIDAATKKEGDTVNPAAYILRAVSRNSTIKQRVALSLLSDDAAVRAKTMEYIKMFYKNGFSDAALFIKGTAADVAIREAGLQREPGGAEQRAIILDCTAPNTVILLELLANNFPSSTRIKYIVNTEEEVKALSYQGKIARSLEANNYDFNQTVSACQNDFTRLDTSIAIQLYTMQQDNNLPETIRGVELIRLTQTQILEQLKNMLSALCITAQNQKMLDRGLELLAETIEESLHSAAASGIAESFARATGMPYNSEVAIDVVDGTTTLGRNLSSNPADNPIANRGDVASSVIACANRILPREDDSQVAFVAVHNEAGMDGKKFKFDIKDPVKSIKRLAALKGIELTELKVAMDVHPSEINSTLIDQLIEAGIEKENIIAMPQIQHAINVCLNNDPEKKLHERSEFFTDSFDVLIGMVGATEVAGWTNAVAQIPGSKVQAAFFNKEADGIRDMETLWQERLTQTDVNGRKRRVFDLKHLADVRDKKKMYAMTLGTGYMNMPGVEYTETGIRTYALVFQQGRSPVIIENTYTYLIDKKDMAEQCLNISADFARQYPAIYKIVTRDGYSPEPAPAVKNQVIKHNGQYPYEEIDKTGWKAGFLGLNLVQSRAYTLNGRPAQPPKIRGNGHLDTDAAAITSGWLRGIANYEKVEEKTAKMALDRLARDAMCKSMQNQGHSKTVVAFEGARDGAASIPYGAKYGQSTAAKKPPIYLNSEDARNIVVRLINGARLEVDPEAIPIIMKELKVLTGFEINFEDLTGNRPDIAIIIVKETAKNKLSVRVVTKGYTADRPAQQMVKRDSGPPLMHRPLRPAAEKLYSKETGVKLQQINYWTGEIEGAAILPEAFYKENGFTVEIINELALYLADPEPIVSSLTNDLLYIITRVLGQSDYEDQVRQIAAAGLQEQAIELVALVHDVRQPLTKLYGWIATFEPDILADADPKETAALETFYSGLENIIRGQANKHRPYYAARKKDDWGSVIRDGVNILAEIRRAFELAREYFKDNPRRLENVIDPGTLGIFKASPDELDFSDVVLTYIKSGFNILNPKGKQVINLGDFISTAIKAKDKSYVEKNIRIYFEKDKGAEFFVNIDPGELERILSNFLVNIPDFVSPKNGAEHTVTIKLKKEGSFVAIYVEDDAGGIRKLELLDECFDPVTKTPTLNIFLRGTTTNTGGVDMSRGNGLAKARKFAVGMGGDVILAETLTPTGVRFKQQPDDEQLDRLEKPGTIFRITLPLSEAAATGAYSAQKLEAMIAELFVPKIEPNAFDIERLAWSMLSDDLEVAIVAWNYFDKRKALVPADKEKLLATEVLVKYWADEQGITFGIERIEFEPPEADSAAGAAGGNIMRQAALGVIKSIIQENANMRKQGALGFLKKVGEYGQNVAVGNWLCGEYLPALRTMNVWNTELGRTADIIEEYGFNPDSEEDILYIASQVSISRKQPETEAAPSTRPVKNRVSTGSGRQLTISTALAQLRDAENRLESARLLGNPKDIERTEAAFNRAKRDLVEARKNRRPKPNPHTVSSKNYPAFTSATGGYLLPVPEGTVVKDTIENLLNEAGVKGDTSKAKYAILIDCTGHGFSDALTTLRTAAYRECPVVFLVRTDEKAYELMENYPYVTIASIEKYGFEESVSRWYQSLKGIYENLDVKLYTMRQNYELPQGAAGLELVRFLPGAVAQQLKDIAAYLGIKAQNQEKFDQAIDLLAQTIEQSV